MQITCCHHCTKRYLGCHSECPEYIKQRKQLDEYNELVSRKRHEESLAHRGHKTTWRSHKVERK